MTTYVMRSTRDGVVAEASIEIASDQRFADFTIVVDRRRPGGRWQRVAELEGTDGTLLAAVVIAVIASVPSLIVQPCYTYVHCASDTRGSHGKRRQAAGEAEKAERAATCPSPQRGHRPEENRSAASDRESLGVAQGWVLFPARRRRSSPPPTPSWRDVRQEPREVPRL